MLCLVFISRIMFVQIGIFQLSNTTQSKPGIQKLTISADTKHSHFEAENELRSGNYWAMEILESNSDVESKLKHFIIPIIQVFNAESVAALTGILRSFQLTGDLSFVSEYRYLALGVFRI